MSDDSTPTTQEIRNGWSFSGDRDKPLFHTNPSAEAEFDRWLEAHDAEVEAAALYKAGVALQNEQVERFGVILPDVRDDVEWLDDRAQEIAS